MSRRGTERMSVGGSCAVLVLVLLACKSGKTDETTASPAPSAPPSATAAASEQPDTAPPPTPSMTAVAAPTQKPAGKADIIDPTGGGTVRTPAGMMPVDGTDCPDDYAGPLPPENKCHKRCSSNADCKSKNCMSVQNVKMCMGADVVDNSNMPPDMGDPTPTPPPRAAGPTVGVSFKDGDCPDGWNASVSEANKCDKECKTDAECGPGNKCKAVGPIEAGKQCQKG